MIRKFALAVLATATISAATLAVAQAPPTPAAQPVLKLSLGDLMTALVQPRHIKLALAGKARNWDYAAFGLHELEETFEMIEQYVPRYRNAAMPDLMKMIEASMKTVEAAIKAKDGAAFDAAFAKLTDACNACHVTTEHKAIVIRVPTTSPFPNQVFEPQRP